MTDPHDIDNGGHEPVDVDPFIPTGICIVCSALAEPEPDTIPEEE